MDSKTSTTFNVSDIKPKKYDGLISSKSHAEQIANFRPYKEGGCKEILQTSHFPPNTHLSGRTFVGTVVDAYSDHHNLVIRPDDVWAAVMTQFSFYINKNAEKFRRKFVNFEKKMTLTVIVPGSIRANNDLFVKRMTEKIHENLVDPEVKEWILPNFSTTTENDIVSIGVIFMATMKKYFNYRRMGCGIPNVTLEGTTEDWKAVLDRLEKLKEYELEKWYDLLKPVFQQFVNAKEGKVDLDFWQRICHYIRNSSATSYLSGWITVFCVFDKDGNWRKSIWDKKEDIKLQTWLRFDIKTIPTGPVEVDVDIVDDDGVEHKSLMIAGHMGAEVKEDGKTLQPTLGWAIALMLKGSNKRMKVDHNIREGYYN